MSEARRGYLELVQGDAVAGRKRRASQIARDLQERAIAGMTDVAKHLRHGSPNRVILERTIEEARTVLRMIDAQLNSENNNQGTS